MNWVSGLDMVTLLACFAAMLVVVRLPNTRLGPGGRYALLALLLLNTLHYSVSALEWRGSFTDSHPLEAIEDFAGLILPVIWLGFFNALFQEAGTEAKYRLLLDTSPNAFLIVNASAGTIVEANRVAQEWLGTNLFAPRPPSATAPSDPGAARLRVWMEALLTPTPSALREVILPTVSGKELPLELTTSQIDLQGQRHVLGVFRDLSERKQAEAALVEQERLAALGVVTGGVAHEYNNAMTPIRGYLEMLLSDDQLPEEMRQKLDAVHRATQRVCETTRHLLTYTSDRSAGIEPVELVSIVEEARQLTAHDLKREGIEFAVHAEPGVVAAVNAREIGQVLLNLFVNARHALLQSESKSIVVSVGHAGGDVYLRVQDSGCGIAPQDLPRVALPFFSRKGEHARPGSPLMSVRGSGLGLSLADRITRNQGGRMEITSTLGKGTTVTLYFPATAAPASGTQSQAQSPPRHPGPRPGLRLLVVDDDEDVLDFLEAVLRETHPGAMTFCRDGAEALRQVESEPPFDIALVDLQMAVMSGVELIGKLAQLPPPKRPRIIVSSGQADADAMVSVNKVDVETIIAKPFAIDDLLQALGNASRR